MCYNAVYLHYNLKRYNMELRIKDVLKEKKVTVVSLAGMSRNTCTQSGGKA